MTVIYFSYSLSLVFGVLSHGIAWQHTLALQAKTLQMPPDARFPPLQRKDEATLHIPHTLQIFSSIFLAVIIQISILSKAAGCWACSEVLICHLINHKD